MSEVYLELNTFPSYLLQDVIETVKHFPPVKKLGQLRNHFAVDIVRITLIMNILKIPVLRKKLRNA